MEANNMYLIVPEYLRVIATKIDILKENGIFSLKCNCDCESFSLLKNRPHKSDITREDAQKIKLTKKWWRDLDENPNIIGVTVNNSGTKQIITLKLREIDSNGQPHKTTRTIIVTAGNIPLDSSELAQLAKRDDTVILKAKCSACGKEHLLFDSRIHGNDAADFKPEKLEDYAFRQLKGLPAQIQIHIKNFWDLEDIESNQNPELTADDYSEMFGYIKIISTDQSGKKKIIYSSELG
jgi:hypothetical protein